MVQLNTSSYWAATAPTPAFPSLDRDLRVDVAIVGGGITGITAAYLLKSAGVNVALLERSRCASGDTGYTTAHLTMVTDALLTSLVKNFGRDTATAVWDAGRIAIDRIEEPHADRSHRLRFSAGARFLARGAGWIGTSTFAELERQVGRCHRAGLRRLVRASDCAARRDGCAVRRVRLSSTHGNTWTACSERSPEMAVTCSSTPRWMTSESHC